MTGEEAAVPAGIDTTVPSPARVYDCFLGGKDNFAADRAAAQEIIAGFPDAPRVARQNRAFMRRAAAVMAEEGIGQFIDLGSGLPTADNLHHVVHRTAPGSRVVYVDNDPLVLAHGRALLADDASTKVVTADLREPETVLSACQEAGIDLGQPVGLAMIAVLHFVPGDLAALVGAYRKRLARGSYLALSHVTADGLDPERTRQATGTYARTASGLHFRSREEIEALFEGTWLLEPGVVPTWQWRPAAPADMPRIGGEDDQATSPVILAGVGHLLAPSL
ncbi:SAM-dependent methyltransferase [Actinocorallia libanotica]|uniref:SAM-dependent methyltransferase n=1 Tax=Actinocorallia libanotica TaxID=46162 RepID=A0ABN1REX4_9ACTN